MGWTFLEDKPPTMTPAAFIASKETEAGYSEVVQQATVNSTVFLAVKVLKPTDLQREIFEVASDGSITMALVCMFKTGAGGFGWKTMDEMVGPLGEKAPVGIMEKLSKVKPGSPSFAEKWRVRQKAP